MSNRLSTETSPYLLQHKDNPVDWYPWGEEALQRAQTLGRPILLSIGYSACHWCHVMERESFEDPATAAVMNDSFINIKVDREERPDIDAIYMQAVQALTGQGGWPLTVFLTPTGVPYYGGTYFPPRPHHGLPSFRQVLDATNAAFHDRPEEVAKAAEELRSVLLRSSAPSREASRGRGAGPDSTPALALLERAYRFMLSRYDPVQGGFGGAPKFPQPLALDVCLRWHARSGDGQALEVVVHTLRKMAAGGIHDHLGGGFHRYAVDARWLVPHFEKMLYDNALLARGYLNAYRITGDEDFRRVTERTLDYLLTDLRSPEGGFYTARDADSEGEEGKYYVWSADEVDTLLDRERATLFKRCYDVTQGGNWEGTNIAHLPHDLDAVARSEGLGREELDGLLSQARESLLEARALREPPLRDEKVLAGWNGLAILAFAEAGAALRRPDYVEAARAGVAFILGTMRKGDVLRHSYKDGRLGIPGLLEDYGAVGLAILSLYEATLDDGLLPEVEGVAEEIIARFWEEGEGVFYDTPSDGEELLMRPRSAMDSPTPSGSSLAIELLLRAGALLGRDSYGRIAEEALAAESAAMERYPLAFGSLLGALDFHLSIPVEVALVGRPADPGIEAFLHAVHRRYLPNRIVAGKSPDAELPRPVPLLEGKTPERDVPTAYLCRNFACREPVTGAEALERQLDEAGL